LASAVCGWEKPFVFLQNLHGDSQWIRF